MLFRSVIVAAITSKISKPKMQTHVAISKSSEGLERDSVVLLEQIRTIDKRRLKQRIMCLGSEHMKQVDYALEVSLGLHKIKRVTD